VTSSLPLLAGLAIVALLFVVLPVFLATFLRYRAPRHLACPVAAEGAEVTADATHAALTATMFGRACLRVASCSLWPTRYRCGQLCIRGGAAGSEGATR
jgi:hypothetical protein